jgi:hypothetical protein
MIEAVVWDFGGATPVPVGNPIWLASEAEARDVSV